MPTQIVGFRTVHVFDISQTEGKDFSCGELHGTADFIASPGLDTEELTQRLLRVCPVPLLRRPLTGMRGYYDPVNGVIVLSEGLSDREVPRTLIHEIAHWWAIKTGEHGVDAERPMGEVVAEAAAFIALSHFGLDTGSISFAYVAGWGRDIKKVISWGSAAMRVAERSYRSCRTQDGKKTAAVNDDTLALFLDFLGKLGGALHEDRLPSNRNPLKGRSPRRPFFPPSNIIDSSVFFVGPSESARCSRSREHHHGHLIPVSPTP